jgi:Sigma-70 region 2
MDERDWLARRFEAHRPHLRAVAYRMLGSLSEADDAVQEAWLRLSRIDAGAVDNLGGWLTTVVASRRLPGGPRRPGRGLPGPRLLRTGPAGPPGPGERGRRPGRGHQRPDPVGQGFTVARGRIVEIDILTDPERLRRLDLAASRG